MLTFQIKNRLGLLRNRNPD